MTRLLTKTAYLRGRQCGLRLWHWGRGLREREPGPEQPGRDVEHEAAAVEALAYELFPGGVAIARAAPGRDAAAEPPGFEAGFETDFEAGLARTRAALDDPRVRAIFQAHFADDESRAVVDILARDGAGWRVVEVKASKRVKALHLEDLAFQWSLLERLGLDVRGAEVVHLNGAATRGAGPLGALELLVQSDVGEEVRALLPETRAEVAAQLALLAGAAAPAVAPGPHCRGPSGDREPRRVSACGHLARSGACGALLPEHWVWNLPRLGGARKLAAVAALDEPDARRIDLEDGAGWTRAQRAVVLAARTGEAQLDRASLRRWLERLEFPVAYVDFEFDTGVAIPRFEGMRPYDKLPFQWSMHVQAEPGGPLREPEPFLHLDASDPREPFVASLLEALPASGSIVAHHVDAERGVLRDFERDAWLGGRYRRAVRALGRRWKDTERLLHPNYCHPEQRGSWSLKRLAPAILGRAYADLELQDGLAAVRAWRAAVAVGGPPDARAALLAYCSRDTELLHGIVEALRAEVEKDRG